MNRQAYGLIAVLLLAFSQPALSQETYFDGGIGTAEIDESGFDGDDTYFRLGVGYRISDAVAIEGGWWDLGEAEDGGVSAEADGLFGAVKGTLDTGGPVDIFGRIGLYLWDSEVCVDGFGCDDDDGSDLFFGGGIAFEAGPGDLNLEIHVFELDDTDVDTFGVSYTIPFGQ